MLCLALSNKKKSVEQCRLKNCQDNTKKSNVSIHALVNFIKGYSYLKMWHWHRDYNKHTRNDIIYCGGAGNSSILPLHEGNNYTSKRINFFELCNLIKKRTTYREQLIEKAAEFDMTALLCFHFMHLPCRISLLDGSHKVGGPHAQCNLQMLKRVMWISLLKNQWLCVLNCLVIYLTDWDQGYLPFNLDIIDTLVHIILCCKRLSCVCIVSLASAQCILVTSLPTSFDTKNV